MFRFIARYKGNGKKAKSHQSRIFLHGTRFYRDRKIVLNDYFIEQTHLDDPAIRDQVINTLRELYGLYIIAHEISGTGADVNIASVVGSTETEVDTKAEVEVDTKADLE